MDKGGCWETTLGTGSGRAGYRKMFNQLFMWYIYVAIKFCNSTLCRPILPVALLVINVRQNTLLLCGHLIFFKSLTTTD